MIIRVMLGLAAVTLGLGSLVMTTWFASTLGDGVIEYLWIAVALAAGVLKLTLPPAWVGLTWRASMALIISWVFALVIDSSFQGGFISMTRETTTGHLLAVEKARDDQAKRVTDAVERLAKVPEPRPIEQIKADLENAKSHTKNCRGRRAEKPSCVLIASLEREEATAAARARLAAELDTERLKYAAMPEVIVYPEAHRIGNALRSAGLTITDGAVSTVLQFILVMFFEIASVTCFKRALIPVSPPVPRPGYYRPPEPSPPAYAALPPAARRATRSREPAGSQAPAVLAALANAAGGNGPASMRRAGDGSVYFSQRAASKELRLPQRALADALRVLEAGGRITLGTSPNGTVVRVVGGGLSLAKG